MIISERKPAALMKMQAIKPSLSRSEQQVVDYIVANPENVIRFSVAGLAEGSGVSESTVVRTCQKLGYNGYQDFKVTLAQDIVTPLQNIHEEIKEGDSLSTIVDKVFQGTLHTVNFTYDIIKVDQIEQVVEALLAARFIMVVGLGNSHAVAIDLYHKLMRLGRPSLAYTDSHFQAIAAASLITSEDVVFAISHSGSSKDIVDIVQAAKEKGAKTISMTNIGISPLCRLTDMQLYTASKETQYRIVALSSRIAQMALIDVLYTVLASRLPEAANNFHRVDEALSRKKY